MGISHLSDPIKRKMIFFFLLDVSGSMNNDGKIGSLNECMEETLSLAQDLDISNIDIQIEFAILLFGTGYMGEDCTWLTPEPEPVSKFEWTPISAYGRTPMAKALNMLNKAMSRNSFMGNPSSYMAPVVIFISDGKPWIKKYGERQRVYSELSKLNNNSWFTNSIRTAIGLGHDADYEILSAITGQRETVFNVENSNKLKETIKFIVITSSMIMQTQLNNKKQSFNDEFKNKANYYNNKKQT